MYVLTNTNQQFILNVTNEFELFIQWAYGEPRTMIHVRFHNWYTQITEVKYTLTPFKDIFFVKNPARSTFAQQYLNV